MRRAWLVLMGGVVCAGCAFHGTSSSLRGDDADGSGSDSGTLGDDGGTGDGSAADTLVVLALKDATNHVDWSGSANMTIPPTLDIQTSVMLDTTTGTSDLADVSCLVISVTVAVTGAPTDHVEVCALSATAITLRSDATLRAHGTRPLVLVGKAIDIEGKIDVASHAVERGAGSNTAGCAAATPAKDDGGGAGGSFDGAGGKGGDQGGHAATGGPPRTTISTSYLRGGCDGAGGGDGSNAPATSGGAGGGVVWIASNTGALTIGVGAQINASGAGGVGGKAMHYGGSGGGSGGLIVLQASTIQRNAAAKIFANGGHGGGGDGDQAGLDGTDPDTVSSGGSGGGGNGASNNGNNNGNGGRGYAGSSNAGIDGDPGSNSGGGFGGGGGGGGAGAIRVASSMNITSNMTSPNPVLWTPAP